MWDVDQYERFRGERARPFHDLIARVTPAHRVVDLGCGTGELPRELAERWPGAHITGVDSSAEMLAAAMPRALPGRLDFQAGDIATWRAAGPTDLLLSNAALHWVPDHERLLAHLAGQLAPGGALAVQMPANFDSPSHLLIAETAADGPWADQLPRALQRPVHRLTWYVEQLWRLGFRVDAWETTYQHVLPGDDAVLEWVKGTALRPILTRLDADSGAAFIAALRPRLAEAYPRGEGGTLLAFKRIFWVATLA